MVHIGGPQWTTEGDMAKHNDPSFKLRIPREALDHLRISASRTERSMGSYLVFLLRQDMKTKKASDQPGSNPDASTTTV